MKLNRFCAKCGTPLQEDVLDPSKFLCAKCNIQSQGDFPVPSNISLRKCFRCGAFSLIKDEQQFEWQYKPDAEDELDFLSRILYEHIFSKLEKKTKLMYQIFVSSTLNLSKDQTIEVIVQTDPSGQGHFIQKTLNLRVKERQCEHCAKKLGGRFDAVIQIRIFNDRDQPRLVEIMEYIHQLDCSNQQEKANCFISKIEPTTNGYDIKVSNNVVLKSMVASLRGKFNFEMKLSKTLSGVDHQTGGELYRNFVLLKLVPVQRNDVVRIEDKIYLIKNFVKNKVLVQNKTTGKNTQLPFTIFEKKKYQILPPEPAEHIGSLENNEEDGTDESD